MSKELETPTRPNINALGKRQFHIKCFLVCFLNFLDVTMTPKYPINYDKGMNYEGGDDPISIHPLASQLLNPFKL